MNDLTNITGGPGLTMSSLEIAGLTGKAHRNVTRDIKKMLDALKIEHVAFRTTYVDGKGEVRESFNLPRHETLLLVTGYSIPLRDRVLRRVEELEAMIAHATPAPATMVSDLTAEVRQVVGGIIKSVTHKELTEIIPALVRSELASQALLFRHGRTAGEIWRLHGFPPIRVTCWFSNRLIEMGCQIEGGGRGEIGGRSYKLFDPDKADLWMKNGGRKLVEAYVAERQGQSKLRLVGGRAA